MQVSTAQAPASHLACAWVMEQGLLQPPQARTLVLVSVSQPSPYWPLQSSKPRSQEAMPHVRDLHCGVPLAAEQLTPQPPQLTVSIAGLLQTELQQVQPPLQAIPQAP